MNILIGELSRRTECNIETIRYYERIGLLPRPDRRNGRFRRYGAPDIGRLKFVRRARQLGFSLDDVRALLRLAATDGADVGTAASAKVTLASKTEIPAGRRSPDCVRLRGR